MVRATAAEVLKLFGGTYPPGVDATNITNLLPIADYAMDGYALREYGATLSTTDTAVINAANLTVGQLGLRVMWYQAGGALSGMPEPPILTEPVILVIEASLKGSATSDFTTLNMIDEDA